MLNTKGLKKNINKENDDSLYINNKLKKNDYINENKYQISESDNYSTINENINSGKSKI
jgi:hypothetical protein